MDDGRDWEHGQGDSEIETWLCGTISSGLDLIYSMATIPEDFNKVKSMSMYKRLLWS